MTDASDRPRGLDRPRNRYLLLAFAIALAFAGLLISELMRIKRDLDAGREALAHIELATIDEQGGIQAFVEEAAERIESADRRARTSPALRLLGAVPGVGSQVDAMRELTAVAAELAEVGRAAATDIQTTLDATSGPEGRVELVRTAHRVIVELQAALDAVEIDADRWLIAPLGEARHDLRASIASAQFSLIDAERTTTMAERVLVGPRRYLVLAGNNAEMRSIGIPTVSSIATFENGNIDVGEFTEAIQTNENGTELTYQVPTPQDYEDVYGFLNGDQGYRTTVTSPNWPLTAQIMSAITDRNMYGPVEGIIYVDTVTLAQVLDVIGPVEVDGVEYTFENVGTKLLYENYLNFGRDAVGQEGRRDLQSRVGNAIFDAVETRSFSLLKMAGRLAEMARGRHLLGWSRNPEENELWASFGADGALPPNGLLVVVNQLNASKLDFFTDYSVEVTTEDIGEANRITLTVTLVNPEHPETSAYIDGGGRYADPGEWGAHILVYMPGEATDIGDPSEELVALDRDAPLDVAATIMRVPEGETRTFSLSFTLPDLGTDVVILPSGRIFPVVWTVDGQRIPSFEPFEIDLVTGELYDEGFQDRLDRQRELQGG